MADEPVIPVVEPVVPVVEPVVPANSDDLQKQVDAMSAKMAELLDETKKAKADKAQAVADAETARLAEAAKAGDFKELFADSEKKREELEQKLKDQTSATESSKHRAAAIKLAGTLTNDSTKASLLADKIVARTKPGEDGLKVLNEQGELTVSPVETLTEDLKTLFPFLVDGSQASGGGATGSNNNNVPDAINAGAEAAKKAGDPVAYINAMLKQNLKGNT